ncbi:MAG: GNAT family N-acetyltransferase [Promethearchaeota archaeon]
MLKKLEKFSFKAFKKPKLPEEIENSELKLKVSSEDEAEYIYNLLSDDDVIRYIRINTPLSIKHQMELQKRNRALFKKGFEFRYSIHIKEGKNKTRFCGEIIIYNIDDIDHFAEIGIWLGKAFWGQNIAFKAAELLIPIAFNHLNLHRIEAKIIKENKNSIKLFEKLNFKLEGELRDRVYLKGEYHNVLIYSLLRPELML